MGRTIVITSGKGGVGKTTSTANIGVALGLAGQKVVVVDADIGLRNLDVVLGLENRIVYNLVDVTEGKCRLKQALIKDKRFPGLHLLAAAQMKDKTAVTPNQVKDLVAELEISFDFVIIDCPAGIERGFQNAVAGANEALVITTPEVSAVRDADRIIGLLDNSGISSPMLVVNKVRPEMMRRGEMMDIEDILDILAIELIGIVPDEKDIVVASNRGEPVAAIETSLTGQAYRNIAKRIVGEDIPFLDLAYKESMLKKLSGLFKHA